jgi:hypothetical protein
MKYILSHPNLTRSAKPLAKKIGELVGEEIEVRTIPDNRYRIIIRYGNSTSTVNATNNYNSPEHIRIAGNKLRLSQFLMEKEFPQLEVDNDLPDKYPIVVRTELNRGGGIGIEICESESEFREKFIYRHYWTPWYNFQFELGVHILGGEIARVFKKVRSEELEEEKYPIKNTQRGYNFKLRENWKERYRGLDKFVAKLYEIFPIQFARLDVGYDKETGGYRLIEINSAPDLSQNHNTLELYAKFLAKKIGE